MLFTSTLTSLTYILIFISDIESLLMKRRLHLLPGETAVTRAVQHALRGVHQNNFVVVATPHQVMHLTLQIECLEIDRGRHICFLFWLFVHSHTCLNSVIWQ